MTWKRTLSGLLVLAVLAAFGLWLAGCGNEEIAEGTVNGYVIQPTATPSLGFSSTAPSGTAYTPVANADVTCEAHGAITRGTYRTGTNGFYTVTGPVGVVTLRATKAGFAGVSRTITIVSGNNTGPDAHSGGGM